MKHVDIAAAQAQLASLVADVEQGCEVVLTRDSKLVAKLVPTTSVQEKHYTPEEIARRRKALEEIHAIGQTLDIHMTREEIKASIEEGRH